MVHLSDTIEFAFAPLVLIAAKKLAAIIAGHVVFVVGLVGEVACSAFTFEPMG